jgi:hypothetical protein
VRVGRRTTQQVNGADRLSISGRDNEKEGAEGLQEGIDEGIGENESEVAGPEEAVRRADWWESRRHKLAISFYFRPPDNRA